MLERKKICPVCHGLAAVLDGNPEKYGDRAMGWHRFIATKYCSDECRDIMNGQSRYLADKRYRERRKKQREAALDAIDALREEVKAYREEARLSREEARLARERIAELEAKL